MKLGRVGVRTADVVLVVVVSIAGLLASEMGFRAIDGYELWSVRLVQSPASAPSQDPPRTEITTREYAARIPLAAGMKPEWFDLSPPPVPRKPVNPVFTRIDKRYAETKLTFELFHVYNSSFIAQQMCSGYFKRFPGFFFIYDPPSGSQYPRYRFPRNEVTPYGLVTNQFGWRGPPIELRKPPNTIRIAFVGSSTTVNNHNYPFSYPELAGFLLNKWAQEIFGVHVETINAGREGITSTDIAAIVRDEVVPLEPDLVVYYEGSNQFNPRSIIRLSGDPGPQPNPGDRVSDQDISYFGERSALLRRLLEASSARAPEPGKPAHQVVWPADVNELDPPLDHKNLPVALTTIIHDLDDVRDSVTKAGGELAVSSFFWLVYDGMRLDPIRHKNLYNYLNETFYPYRYREMERLAAFQNRVLKKYAAHRDSLFMDIAGTMPRDPDLFVDAIHATYDGVRLHAWIAAQMLAPWIRERIRSNRLPRPPRSDLQAHPAFQKSERTLLFDCRPRVAEATTIADVDLSKAVPVTEATRVQPGSTLTVQIAPNTRLHLYAARIPLLAQDAGIQLNRPWQLRASMKVIGGDARIGVLSRDEQSFLTYQTVGETHEFISLDVPFWSSSLGPLIISAGTVRPNEVVVELRDVRIIRFPPYRVGESLPGLSEPPPP